MPQARVTQVAVEALRGGVPKGRVTQVVVEALRDSYVPQTYFSAATTAIDVGLAASQVPARWFVLSATTGLLVGLATHIVHEVFASAGTSLELTIRGSGRGVRFLAVSATTGLELLHATGLNKVAVATAATGILVGQRARDAGNPNLFVEASTDFQFGSLGDYFTLRTYFVNAATLVGLGIVTSYRRDVAATATTGIDVGSSGDARLPVVFVSAATGLDIGLAADAVVPGSPHVFATTRLAFDQGGSAINTGKYVSASTLFTLRNRPVAAMNFTFHVRATTALEVLDPATVLELHAVLARATTGLALGQVAGQVRDLPSTASTVLELGAAGISNGRDVFVSATTGMAMGLDEATNQFVAVTGTTSGLDFAIDAAAAIAGTPAGSGLVFVHRADAEVWLPWRRQTLTLPPGGQLPH